MRGINFGNKELKMSFTKSFIESYKEQSNDAIYCGHCLTPIIFEKECCGQHLFVEFGSLSDVDQLKIIEAEWAHAFGAHA